MSQKRLGGVYWIDMDQMADSCERGDGPPGFGKIRGISLLAEELLGICSMESVSHW
jgi:hypothetical protein